MSNPKDTKMTPISALIEVFPLCQKVILNTVDFKDHGFTKTQLCILLSLTAKSPLTMSELAAYIPSCCSPGESRLPGTNSGRKKP